MMISAAFRRIFKTEYTPLLPMQKSTGTSISYEYKEHGELDLDKITEVMVRVLRDTELGDKYKNVYILRFNDSDRTFTYERANGSKVPNQRHDFYLKSERITEKNSNSISIQIVKSVSLYSPTDDSDLDSRYTELGDKINQELKNTNDDRAIELGAHMIKTRQERSASWA